MSIWLVDQNVLWNKSIKALTQNGLLKEENEFYLMEAETFKR